MYHFVTEEKETRVERKLSERMSPKRSRSGRKKSGIFMTQEEGMLLLLLLLLLFCFICMLLLFLIIDRESAHVALATENLVMAGGAFTEVKHG